MYNFFFKTPYLVFKMLLLVVFYYLRASEIWPDKRGGLWWEWPYKRGGIS
jgi:hypothetical protein